MAEENTTPTPDPAAPPAADPKSVTPPADPKTPEPKVEDKSSDKSGAPAERKTLEQKLADKKAADAAAKTGEGKPEDKKPDAKPDASGIEIKLPEGVKVDEKAMSSFKAISAELGVKSEGAQKLFDFYSKFQAEQSAAATKEINDTQDKWESELLAMPDVEEKLGLAKRAIEKLGDKEVQSMLQDSYLGSNPAVVQFLAKVGKLVSEDKIHEPGTPGEREATLQALFPLSAKK